MSKTIEATAAVVVEAAPLVCETLQTILTWPRGHGTPNEIAFRTWVGNKIRGFGGVPVIMADNITVEVGVSTTMFSCHMDTVGDIGVEFGRRKSLTFDEAMGIIALDKASAGGSLGADDGVGVWIMLHMIEKKVPGFYVFHVGEEVGCIGSRAMLAGHPTVLAGYEAAIAFDRPNDYEVITHQGGMKCASDKYGTALVKALNEHGFKYETSNRGVLTDVKMYRGIIAECINLGVGYEQQHGKSEWLNYEHALKLRDACAWVAWDSMPIDRDPAEVDVVQAWDYRRGNRWVGNQQATMWDYKNNRWKDDLDDLPPVEPKVVPKAAPKVGGKAKINVKALEYFQQASAFDELDGNKRQDMLFFAESDPEATVDQMILLMREIASLRGEVALLEKML